MIEKRDLPSLLLYPLSFRQYQSSSAPCSSFPRSMPLHAAGRGRESSKQTFIIRSFVIYWIPAFAGMTNGARFMSLRIIHFLCLLLMFGVTGHAAQDKQPLTLESIFAGGEFDNNLPQNIQWHNGSGRFTFTRINPETGLADILAHDVATGASRLVIPGDALRYENEPVRMSGCQWAAGGQYILLAGPVNTTWDGRSEAPYYIYEPDGKELWPLAGTNPRLLNVRLSPDGARVGYVLDNNIYITELDSRATRAVTTDGNENVFNGYFDYGSRMFGAGAAWSWSQDGKKIAFWRMDVTDVKEFYMVDELGKYNAVRPLKYPNTGERLAVTRIGVFDLESGRTSWMDTGDEPDGYIPRVNWTNSSGALAIQRLARDHDTLTLLLADAVTGESRAIVSDTDPAWVEVTNDLLFFRDREAFVWTSEKSGYRHAYLYDYEGTETPLTHGDWEISALIALDERAGWLYFYAKKDSFTDQHVYRVRLDGSKIERLTSKPGWHEWQFSPDRRMVIETRSDANTPHGMTLRKANGETVSVLEPGRLAAMEKYVLPRTEFIKVETGDGIVIDGYLIKPPDFDPGKKYPVIGHGYGNAGSQVVVNRWVTSPWQQNTKQDIWHRYMAAQGYIIFTMDNRTTAGRGKAAKNLTYGHYGKYAVLDYLEGVNYLKSLPYVDADRLGFWGWSGGGYLAAALMTKGAPHFKTAVSIAPVIDLDRYQAYGVERWMDSLENNLQGYYEVNLMNFADRLQGNLLLIHGTGDENVKYGFTLQLADALIAANKQFDMMIYPNQRHDLDDVRLHLFTRITNYFLEKL